ncbi:MAG: lpoA [Gammaproteobacteria bacterium]|nr:lpoA [Gammaproteobacteria bacterium]
MIKHIFIVALSLLGLTNCTTPEMLNGAFGSAPPTTRYTDTSDPVFWEKNTTAIWDKLTRTAFTQLQTELAQTDNPINSAWLRLAIINKQYSSNTPELINQLMRWRKENPSHPANILFPSDTDLSNIINNTAPKHIALLLPLHGQLGTQGQIVRDGFLNAYYESSLRNQQTVSFYDTSENPTAALYQEASNQGADIIIGPLTKDNVQKLLKQTTFPIPVIALNYTDGSLPTHFYEFGLSPIDEAQQIADRAWQSGHSRALIIAPQNEWGQRITKPLIARWQALNGKVSDTYFFMPTSNLSEGIASLLQVDQKEDRHKMAENNDKAYLEQQRRQDFDVIFMIAQPQTAREIVPLLKYYYADNIPIYASSSIYSGIPDPQKDSDLNGVYFCDIPWTLKNATNPLSKGDASHNRLYAVGLDAYLLSNNLPRLTNLPHFPLYAATGALSLSPNNKIYRRLPWTQMHDGHP